MESFPRKNSSAVKETRMLSSRPPPPPINAGVGETGKAKRKSGGVRMWMRFDRTGATELVKCDKTTIINRASVSARDLRIAFSHSSKILVKEKAIVVNLEVINAIVTAEEVMLLDPLRPQVLTLIDRLKQEFPQRNGLENALEASSRDDQEGVEGLESELPFEFQVLEIALDVVCSFINSNVAALETQAWAFLDELTKKVSIENLTYLRSLKSNLTYLTARVQKVRDEIEHLLDDKEDMANLYLTRKWIKNQRTAPNNTSNLHRVKSNRRSATMVREEDDVDDVEMLLEAYLMQLEDIRNKILMMKEHIDSTEAYVKIEQSNERNGLIELKMKVDINNFAITAGTLVVNLFGMNIPIALYSTKGVFGYVVGSVVALCIALFMIVLGYAKRKKLLS